LPGYIPTKQLGSFFKGGQLQKVRDEETLGFLMGIFGCPYDFNIGDLLLQIAQAVPEKFPIEKSAIIAQVRALIKKCGLAKKNVLPSKISNPTYKMDENHYAKEFLTLADAGFDFNLTVPPLSRRKVDIIRCYDASTDSCKKGFPELQLVKNYADNHGMPFPCLKYKREIDQHVTIFKWDEQKRTGKKIPTIIYFGNPIQHSTFKLKYSKKEFDELCDYMKQKTIKNKNAIVKEIVEKSLSI